MKRLITTVGLVLSFAIQTFAGDRTAFARVTVYWPGEGSGKSAAWNGVQLRENHCAVDPKKIPYGSKISFGDAECMAVDTGPDVVKRKAARSIGRTTAERNAIVVDRFFESKQSALAWASGHPHFMMVRVETAETKQASN
jgi:3D (Asp-Asp-Asp) domain-containing protein